MKLYDFALFIMIIVALFGYYEYKTTPPVEKGKLVFEESFHNFGVVTEGDIIKHTFNFRNDGKGPVRIKSTKTSCGCTTAAAALREYAPGESGTLEVTIDTKGKKGITTKTVEVSLANAEKPMVELSLMAELKPAPHPAMEKDVPVTMNAKCKSCHLESAEGFAGIYLFHRVCSQCHGKRGAGASAKALNDADWLESVTDDRIREVVRGGIPDKGMPPFVEGVTPPLTTEQVDSLVGYVRSLED
jgi:cytochrome c5